MTIPVHPDVAQNGIYFQQANSFAWFRIMENTPKNCVTGPDSNSARLALAFFDQ